MKTIIKHIRPAILLLATVCGLAACSDDRDSNPALDISKAADGFVLNLPATATNNTYDLIAGESVELTCSQPNYGGVPYVTRYYVQVATDPQFGHDEGVPFKELLSSGTNARVKVAANELNQAIIDLFKDQHPDDNFPNTVQPVYIRLRATLDATGEGESFSNVICLPNVLATYKAPSATLPEMIYVVGSSIGEAWNTWRPLWSVSQQEGQFFTVVYLPAGAEFKWGLTEQDWRGYSRLTAINDKAGAGISGEGESNITVANGGWYTLHFAGSINEALNKTEITLNILKAECYTTGGATPDWDGTPMTAPADGSGLWVSQPFTAGGELRAFVNVDGYQWWQTEFTAYKDGSLYFRNEDIPDNWASNKGADWSVSCAAGQKLYVDFNNNTAEVK